MNEGATEPAGSSFSTGEFQREGGCYYSARQGHKGFSGALISRRREK
jgi:hypothetical protein